MSRADLAYVLIALFALTITAVWVSSWRYARYQRSVRRGARHAKAPWKPFWVV